MVSHGAVSLWMHSYRLVVLLARREIILLVVWPVDPTQLCGLRECLDRRVGSRSTANNVRAKTPQQLFAHGSYIQGHISKKPAVLLTLFGGL